MTLSASPLGMEEHSQAYFAWKARGLKDQWCWHVDAHLDIGKTGLDAERLATLRDCTSAEEAAAAGVLGNSYLPWGGLHCGNYLYPAIKEGIVTRLSWVIPPDLPEGGSLFTWAKRHLNNWFELELSEYASLRLEDERVVGTLLGIPFELGALEHLTLPAEPVLMDIDIDYFLREDGTVWQEADRFKQSVSGVPVEFETVAYSVKGGFTPDSERRLAEPFLGPDASPYRATPLDRLACLVRCHKYKEALALDPGTDRPVETEFLRGTSLQALERYEEALNLWENLLEQPGVTTDGQAYLRGLAAELCLETGQYQRGLEHALAGQKLEPDSYRHHFNEAVSREHLDDMRRAVKALRRTIRLSEHLLFGLRARYALSRVYRNQGKEGLAKMELQKLGQLDVTGEYRPVTML